MLSASIFLLGPLKHVQLAQKLNSHSLGENNKIKPPPRIWAQKLNSILQM